MAQHTNLGQIAFEIIGVNPFDADVIAQERFSPPGQRIDYCKLRGMLSAALEMGHRDARSDVVDQLTVGLRSKPQVLAAVLEIIAQ